MIEREEEEEEEVEEEEDRSGVYIQHVIYSHKDTLTRRYLRFVYTYTTDEATTQEIRKKLSTGRYV